MEEIQKLRSELDAEKRRLRLLIMLLIPFARRFGILTPLQEKTLLE